MTGYMNQEPMPEGGWYDTGDIMSRVDRRYYVVGRSKELIKVSGFQLSPAELEATLLTD
jgi:acyl-CoA synthetase (AMP-forming)/AMP-acid ligase II